MDSVLASCVVNTVATGYNLQHLSLLMCYDSEAVQLEYSVENSDLHSNSTNFGRISVALQKITLFRLLEKVEIFQLLKIKLNGKF